MNEYDYSRIFHNSGEISDTNCIKSFFENWDMVKLNFELIKRYLEQIANAYIYRQNEIHARVEFKYHWPKSNYIVTKFENHGNVVRLRLVNSYENVTGEEKQIFTLDIARKLVLDRNIEDWDSFFAEYEANLKDRVRIAKQHAEEHTQLIRRQDFLNAKEIYFALKDEFEKDGVVEVKEPLTYEDWLNTQHYKNYPASEDDAKDFKVIHGLDLNDTVERFKQEEYQMYVDRVKLGLE